MRVVTIRGTSGSGKSTLVRRIMEHYGIKSPVHVERRQKPLFYNMFPEGGGRPLRILGHYETPTGGGDTISDGLDHIDGLARAGLSEGYDVMYEGLVISSDFKRIVGLHRDGHPTLVVVLNTSLEDCLASVRGRREARGNTSPLNPKATTEKHRAVLAMLPRFRAEGLDVRHVDREQGYRDVCTFLDLEPR